jgi:hypothetical protein
MEMPTVIADLNLGEEIYLTDSEDIAERINIRDPENRMDQLVKVMVQFSQDQEVKNVVGYFGEVSEKLRGIEAKLHLTTLKLNLTELRLERAREIIETVYDEATNAPQSQFRDDLIHFIDEFKRIAADQGLKL